MKRFFALVAISWIFLWGCETPQQKAQSEDFNMMNLMIERSRVDTVNKYLRYFIDKYSLPVTPENMEDGLYMGISPKDDFGYEHAIIMDIRDGKIVEVSYDEYKDGHSKTADSAYGAEMNKHREASAPALTYPAYEQQLLEKQDLFEMDAISGATYSMYRLWFVATQALEKGPVSPEAIDLVKQQKQLAAEISHYHNELNRHYADPEHSPLKEEDLKTFQGLDFYPVNTKLIFDVRLNRTPQAVPFMMQRTKDEVKYVKYGEVAFNYNGQPHTLSLYQNLDLIEKNPAYRNHLFLPFTDLTNDEETYGGGRYIDLEIPEGDSIEIDFNKAYNPYCAYNKKYSCPIPPQENTTSRPAQASLRASAIAPRSSPR